MTSFKSDPRASLPTGYQTVIPYLSFLDSKAAIDFYKDAFNAIEISRLLMPNGRVAHAELKIGNAVLFLADVEKNEASSSPGQFVIYTHDVQTLFVRALHHGARLRSPVQEQLNGEIAGTLEDPFGYRWIIVTRIAELSPEQLQLRLNTLLQRKRS